MKDKIHTLFNKARKFICNHKKFVIVLIAVCVVSVASIVCAPKIVATLPCEVKINNKTICCVKNEAIANKVIHDTYNAFLPENAKLIKCSSNKKVSIEKTNIFKIFSEVTSEEDALTAMRKEFKTQKGEDLNFSSTYILTHKEDYIPDPIFKKNKKMLAGREKIKKKGTVGNVEVSTVYVSVNGKVNKKKDICSKVIDEGVPAVVYRGILGLPDGEDWETYKGDPIYKNGEELIKTAYNYIGAPYKHGGTSLKTGVSCVGFVRAIYLKYGIKIGNSHHSMETAGIGVKYENAKKGDIICYKGHVGIYIGNGKMLDATSKRGVGVNKVHKKSIIAVRRVVK